MKTFQRKQIESRIMPRVKRQKTLNSRNYQNFKVFGKKKSIPKSVTFVQLKVDRLTSSKTADINDVSTDLSHYVNTLGH